ncbi:beta-mannosidase [Halobacillus seohaensis]|uniref:Beta-mannosidase B n=1 Tax=Halobacillus seohaensis TaxID=447421 RepID=A0ABW2EME8_9BACI
MSTTSNEHKVNLKRMVLSDWQFKQQGDNQWMPAQVPGCIHTDLLKNNKILDPFHGKNELELQWIDKKDWNYETTFDVSEQLLDSSHIHLVFDGLDTYADVYVNDQHILSADNMFRTWKVDVRSLVQKENNRLSIHFRSPINEDLVKLEQQGYNLPAVNDHSEDGGVGEKNLSVFARKAPYHYGWDWGPRFVTSGVWKEVYLEGWSDCRVTDLFIQQNNVTASSADLKALIEIESESAWSGSLQLSTEGIEIKEEVEVTEGKNQLEMCFTIDEPKLWWSRGLGEQHLYEFSASLLREDRVVADKSVRTGVRSIRVVQEKDEVGKSFYVEVNGVRVFAKGANHIPNDSFETEVTYERYKHEILSAVESNMNMLRIWGGGIYEYDAFYELCDEYGILVWQDFMFACSMYPGDEAFLENVKAEAEENVKRLRNHPSIALWCGNNEMDTAWSAYDENGGWGWKEQYAEDVGDKIWRDYEAVFHEILPEAVTAYDPGTYYWPSSPMSDWTGDENQHTSNTATSGDIHYWDVWHGLKPFEEYNNHVGRFMSEYGFQSFPEEKTVRTYAEEEDMALETEVMLHHQKNDSGNYLIKEYMEKYLPEPKDFSSFLYMSQVLQAEGIKTAIEAHRRKKPYCMGTLYWQMNDCWPVASWASMDYYGRWKALHYYAKKSFQDVMVSIDGTEQERVDIHVVSDILEEITGTLNVKLLNFQGEVVKEYVEQVHIPSNQAKNVLSLPTKKMLEGLNPSQLVLVAQLKQKGEVLDEKEHYFISIRDLVLDQPNIMVTEVLESTGSEFIVETDKLAKSVWISSENEGVFTDNYFDLLPGVAKKVQFHSRDTSFSPSSPGNIVVQSMYNFMA